MKFGSHGYSSTGAPPQVPLPPPDNHDAPDVRIHYQSRESVFSDIIRAGVTGAFIGLAVGVLVMIWVDFGTGVKAAAGVWAVTQAIAWAGLLAFDVRVRNRLETITGIDLDNNGVIGKPDTVRVEVTSEDRRRVTLTEIPYAARLPEFARGLLDGAPVAERHWTGSGNLFSDNEFDEIKRIMLSRGWLVWKNPAYPNLGMVLTASGIAVMRTIARRGLPSPDDWMRGNE